MILTRKVRIQIALFLVIALAGVLFIGIRYAGIGRLVGAGTYEVTVQMPDGGGLFSNAEVTYRGVPIGRVGDMTLTDTGISVQLALDSDAPKVPSDGLEAAVANRSVIGEQYLDLRPQTDSGPYLTDGSIVRSDATSQPPSAEQLLQSIDGFVSSVPTESLQTVVDELGTAFNGTATDLQELLDSTGSFFTTADQNFPSTVALINTSATVLATQRSTSDAITQFSQNLAAVAATLESSDSDLRSLVAQAPAAAQEVTALFQQVGPGLGNLLANLITPAQVSSANVGGVEGLLILLPQAISAGSQVFTPNGVQVGLATTFFDPLPCTQGYGGTPRRSGLDTSPGAPLNTAAGCTASSESGSDVRGSQNAVSSSGR